MTLQELLQDRKATMDKADAIVSASERANRGMTDAETLEFDNAMARVNILDKQIKQKESQNTLTAHLRANGGRFIPGAPDASSVNLSPMPTKKLSMIMSISNCIPYRYRAPLQKH